MSEEHAAPAPKAAPVAPVDPVEELAKAVFIQLSAQVHGHNIGQPKPEHKKIVELSFRLAESFLAGNLEFNTAAKARAEAKAKASVDVSKIEIDFGAIGKT